MQNNNYKDFCKEVYNNTFNSTFQYLCQKHKSQPTEKSKRILKRLRRKKPSSNQSSKALRTSRK